MLKLMRILAYTPFAIFGAVIVAGTLLFLLIVLAHSLGL